MVGSITLYRKERAISGVTTVLVCNGISRPASLTIGLGWSCSCAPELRTSEVSLIYVTKACHTTCCKTLVCDVTDRWWIVIQMSNNLKRACARRSGSRGHGLIMAHFHRDFNSQMKPGVVNNIALIRCGDTGALVRQHSIQGDGSTWISSSRGRQTSSADGRTQ